MVSDTIANKGRPAQVLLVEDNFGDALLTRKAFESGTVPTQISVADSGQKALAMLHQEGEYAGLPLPDLVLLDINLPGMSGMEVLNDIKSDSRTQHIPVVIMTSSRAEMDVARSYSLHANSYIIKPSSLDHLAEVVRTIEKFWFSLAVYPDYDAGRGAR